MIKVSFLKRITSKFRRSEKGATAVEFAILLPVMLVVFAAIVESSRIYWNYQSAVSGVRDASRYLARITNADVCVTNGAGAIPNGGTAEAVNIIVAKMRDNSNLFPTGVTVSAISANVDCIATPTLRTTVTPVARVQATVNIQLPFGRVIEYFGSRGTTVMTSQIVDQSRIYGI